MSSAAIPPTPPPAVQASPTASVPVLTVAVASAAQALAELPVGALVQATLDAVDSGALIQVTTDSGTSLELRLPPTLTLPPDSQLTLQVSQQGDSPVLKLLAVNGQPLPGIGASGLAALAQAANPDPTQLLGQGKSGGTAANPAIAGQPAPGAEIAAPQLMGAKAAAFSPLGLTATVLRPAGAEAAMTGGQAAQAVVGGEAPAGFTNLAVGTQLTVRVAGVVPPPGEPPPGTLAVQAQAGAAQPQGTPSANPSHPQPDQQQQQQPGGQSGGQQPGGNPSPGQTPVVIKPQASAPAPATTGTPMPQPFPASETTDQAAPAAARTMTGVVLSRTLGGTSVIQTPAGVLSLPAGPPASPGSRLILELIGLPLPPGADPPGPRPPLGLDERGWPALDQAVEALMRAEPQALDQLVRLIPQANPHLAAALSAFSRAVRNGDIRQLGADGVLRGLEKAGRRDLADRLRRDFQALAEEAERPRGNGDWQAITLPFAHGAQVDPVRLYVRRIRGDDPSKGGGHGQEHRFVLDVEMSRLGRIQLDGLVQKDTKRFDLIVRSDFPLDADMRRDIAGIFAECGQMTGIKGTVGFQAGRGFVDLPPVAGQGTEILA